jgi:hypothetical protein
MPGAAVIPIEETRVSRGGVLSGWGVYAAKRPVAVVVCRPDETRTFDCDGGEVSLSELLVEVPDLSVVLVECRERVLK